jgi:hypothetical protein
MGFSESASRKMSSSLIGEKRFEPTALLDCWLNADPRQWLLHDRRYGRRSTSLASFLNDRTTSVELGSPISFSGPGYVRARIGGIPPQQLPPRPGVADLIIQNASWHDGTLEVVLHAQDRYRLDVRVPDDGEVLRLVAAVPYEPSDKGKYALALQGIVDPRELLEPGMYEVIRCLTTPRSKERVRQLRRVSSKSSGRELLKLAANWGGRVQQRYRSASQVASESTQPLATVVRICERLSELGLASRGLEVSCDNCGMTSFVPLDAPQGPGTCPGCNTEQPYSLDAESLKVTYRLNSLVDRASDNGVLCHVLAVGALLRLDPRSFTVPGVNLLRTSGQPAELDLLGFKGREVYAGEAKVSARGFVNLRRDFQLSREVGADIHVIACTEAVTDELRERAEREARRQRLELLILDQRSLRPPS